MARSPRAAPDYSRERCHGGLVCGVDEAGRGPLAGPVIAAAVILDPANLPAGLADSKTLSPARRDVLRRAIETSALAWSLGRADVAEIDAVNILQASLRAMTRAVAGLDPAPARALVDGNRLPSDLPCAGEAVIRGDGLSLSIAAASILAKEARDAEMRALDAGDPRYGWSRNMGYGTRAHLEALARHGASPHHRRSFAPVRAVATA